MDIDPDQLKKAIKDYISENKDMSFANFMNSRSFKNFDIKGDMALVDDIRNIVYWTGLSEMAVDVFRELLNGGGYTLKPTVLIVYMADGMALRLPRVLRPPKKRYKEPHWLPTIMVKKAD